MREGIEGVAMADPAGMGDGAWRTMRMPMRDGAWNDNCILGSETNFGSSSKYQMEKSFKGLLTSLMSSLAPTTFPPGASSELASSDANAAQSSHQSCKESPARHPRNVRGSTHIANAQGTHLTQCIQRGAAAANSNVASVDGLREWRSPILPAQQRVEVIRHHVHERRKHRIAARDPEVGTRLRKRTWSHGGIVRC